MCILKGDKEKMSNKKPKAVSMNLLLYITLMSALFIFLSQSSIQNHNYFPNAYGHALPVTYSPSPNSIIKKNEPLPSKIIISFSERPDPKVSYIQVLDSNNKRVDNNDFKITGQQHGREAEVTLDTHKLTDGVYTISWLTMSSDDGHIAKGSYIFGIGNVGGASPSTNTGSLSSGLAGSGNTIKNFAQQNQVKTEAVTSTLDGIIKWPLIVAQAAIVGGIISHLFLWTNNIFVKKILDSTITENHINRNSVQNIEGENTSSKIDDDNTKQIKKIRFKPLKIFVIILCISSASIFACGTALLFLQISDLSNSNSNFFSLFKSLLHDSVGTVWIIRSIASIVVIATSLIYYVLEKKRITREVEGIHANQKLKDIKNKQKHSVLLYIALLAGAIAIFANSMTSHSSGISFLPSIAISLDWLHFMAVSVWVGGVFYISTVLLVLIKSTISNDKRGAKIKSIDISKINFSGPDEKNDKTTSFSKSTETTKNYSKLKSVYFLALLLPKFSLLATTSLGIIGVSGLYMVWIHLHSFNALFDTSYGNILLIKLLTAFPMILLGGYHQLKLHNYIITIASVARRSRKEENNTMSSLKEKEKKQPSLFSSKINVKIIGRYFSFIKRQSNEDEKYNKYNENKIIGKDNISDIYSRFNKTIKIESLIGIAVLFFASILTITSPPAMNMPSSMMMMMGTMGNESMNTNIVHQNQNNNSSGGQKATTMPSQKIVNNSYSSEVKIMDTNTKFQINPFYTGFNTFKITFTGEDGKPAKNISNVVLQFTNDEANIGPIVVNLNKVSDGVYSIFGGYLSQKGTWSIQLTGQRIGAYDLNYEFNVDIKQKPVLSSSLAALPSSSSSSNMLKSSQQKQQQQKLSTLGAADNNNL